MVSDKKIFQLEPNLDGPLPNLCPVIPTSSQDGRQAKNRKRWDEILIVYFYFSRYKSAERNISNKNHEHMINYSLPCSCS
jgi:hypothetical protein